MSRLQPDLSATSTANWSYGSVPTAVGIFVILLGVVSLLNISADAHLAETWWANFIFAPAIVAFMSVPLIGQQSVARQSIASAILLSLGVIIFTLATILLFEAMWFGWTLLLIIPGLVVAANSLMFMRATTSLTAQTWLRSGVWMGSTVSLLGAAFLLMRLDLFAILQLVGSFQWWSMIILLAGGGLLWNAWWLYRRMQYQVTTSVLILGGLGLISCVYGLLEAFHLA